jgi:inner membrane protein
MTHAFMGGVAAKLLPPKYQTKYFWWLALLCPIVPDLDVIAFKFVSYAHPMGHRGFTHSFVFAFLLAAIISLCAYRHFKIFSKDWWKITGFFFVITASHGIFDALTNGGMGVAFFSPFDNTRYFLPWRPLLVSPIGIRNFLSGWGVDVILNELLVIVVPLFLIRNIIRARRFYIVRPWTLVRSIAFFLIYFTSLTILDSVSPGRVLNHHYPNFTHTIPKLLKFLDPASRAESLPVKNLEINFNKLSQLSLFDNKLTPSKLPWSSSFFPRWYGGIAGRWRDGTAHLVLRSVWGFGTLSESKTKALLLTSQKGLKFNKNFLWELSPTEKYDLAIGDYSYKATRAFAIDGHNSPHFLAFWRGYCNGIAAASIQLEEPFRSVKVLNPDGHEILFHPTDIKGLLAAAYFFPENYKIVGKDCKKEGCLLNPATLTLALLNKLGIDQQSFLIEIHPGRRTQLFPISSARIRVTQAPYDPPADMLVVNSDDFSLVDIEIELELASTLLDYKSMDLPTEDASTYQKVGVVPVGKSYPGTLILDSRGNIVGGFWRGRMDFPDFAVMPSGAPKRQGDSLIGFPSLSYSVINSLYQKSISTSKEQPVLQLQR